MERCEVTFTGHLLKVVLAGGGFDQFAEHKAVEKSVARSIAL